MGISRITHTHKSMPLELIFTFLLLSSVQSSAQEDNNANKITGEPEINSRTTELDLAEVQKEGAICIKEQRR